MSNTIARIIVLVGSLLILVPSAWASEPEGYVDFNRQIRPILSENCFFCHGPDVNTRQAGLRLDTLEGASAVIEPGDSSAGELMRRVRSSDSYEVMPPPRSNRSLSKEEIELLERWIDQGAPWDEHWAFTELQKPPVPDIEPIAPGMLRNPIDAFVQAKLAGEGLAPSSEASRETLIRRVTLDLTGLPPTPEAVEAFLQDDDPQAYEKVVDRLLRSPAYGERMAWDWLDAARYADSNGYQGDAERTMWPWRDWVVEAFNDNLPYDQFTIWQLAGDLLPEATFEQQLATGFSRNHMINGEGGRIAEENRVEYVMDMTETMGTVWLGMTLNCSRCHDHKYDALSHRDYFQLFAFFNQTPVDGSGGNPQTPPVLAVPSPEQEQQVSELQQELASLDDQLQHRAEELAPLQANWEAGKLDEQQESPSHEPEDLENVQDLENVATAEENSEDADGTALLAALRTAAEERSAEQAELVVAAFLDSDDTYRQLRTQRNETQDRLAALQGSLPKVMVMQDMPQPRPTYVLDVGLYNEPREEVTADVPAVLPPLPDGVPADRLALARWLVSPENPLTARVTVNRFWQQVFGVGLVNTPEDFGVQGEIPPNPDLLDWLAADFRDNGWDVKRLMRTIVTSHTYRQSSKISGEVYQRDPDNRLLARGPRFRMPSWMLRDQALAASGLLVPDVGGPPVNPYQPPGVWEEATFGNKQYKQDEGAALYRRSVYTFWRRIIAPTMFFDNASRQTCNVSVVRTNTPLQALLTLNDVTYVEAARALAERVLMEEAGDDRQRLDLAFRRLLARGASKQEHQILLAGLERSRREFAENPWAAGELLAMGESQRHESLDAVEHASWTALCLALFNLDETLTKE